MSKKHATPHEKEALEKYLLQFLNLEKQFPLLPGIDNEAALAGLIGLDPEEFGKLRDHFRSNAREAAREMIEEGELDEWLNRLPFSPNDTIVALGDSMTDDLQGWFTILSNLLEIATPDADYTFVNSGISYNTTSEALRRLHRDVLSREPDWVIVSLGTFDAIRPSVAPGRTLLPLSESWENFSTIGDAIKLVTSNPVIWVSPPPVIDGLLEEMDLFDFSIEEMDLIRIREIIAGREGYLVDPAGRRMGYPPEAWYYLSDGINPSLSGHVNTVREIVKTLAAGSNGNGH